MKNTVLALFLIPFCMNGFGATFEIVNVGFTFSPTTLTIKQGDDVTFTLNSAFHNAVEVSQATWDANGSSPVIGFNVPFGGGSVPASQLPVGTHYYVCANHVLSSGMKGIIIVQATSGIEEHTSQNNLLIYPCPAKDNITVQFNSATFSPIEIKLFNLQGKLVDVLLPKTNFSGLLLRKFSLKNATAPGIYIVKVASGDVNSYRRIIVI